MGKAGRVCVLGSGNRVCQGRSWGLREECDGGGYMARRKDKWDTAGY